MNTPTERCRTVLLSDLPATNDAFGSHDRVAQAIAQLVTSDQSGCTIALEGGWGAGKSTVVNLLEAKLKDTDSIRVTVFDAWAHQGDPLRRTFLETMIASLEPWIRQKKEWKERLLELSARTKVANEKRTPLFTTWGKFLAFMLFLVPVGLALASINLLTDAPPWTRNLLVALGAFLAGAPIGTILGRLLWLASKRLWQRITRQAPDRRQATDTWAILTGQTITETVTESFESPNPTSVEFHRNFTELLDDALENADHRLVLVLDNLDRVEPADALSVWSTLQTFLQHGEHAKPTWLDRLWLIIPYDRTSIARLWERREANPEVPGARPLTPAFLAKTFQVTYEVPPPVLSQWRDFLLTLLKRALPDHDESEFQSVYRVYALHKAKGGSSPAPRDLKLDVNDIGALHQQWQDSLPLCHFACYVLLRHEVTNFTETLQTGEGLDASIMAVAGETILDNLAALHFNAKVPLARQLRLGPAIENALGIADSERLRNLESANPQTFWIVLDQLLFTQRLVWREPHALVNAARRFYESGVLESETRVEANSIRTALREAVGTIGAWPRLEELTSSGVVALLRLVEVDTEVVTNVLQSVSHSPVQEPKGGSSGVPPQEWVHSALVILSELASLGSLDPRSHQVMVPSTAQGWIDICHQGIQDDPDGNLRQYLRPQVQTKEVSAVIAEAVSGGSFSEEHANAVRLTVTLPIDQSWSDLIAAMRQRLQAPNSVPANEVRLLIQTLWQLRAIDNSAEQGLSQIGSQGHAAHHLHQAATENDPQAFAWCVFISLRAAPAAQPPPEAGNSHPGHDQLVNLLSNPQSRRDVTAAFADVLTTTGELGLLLTIRAQNPNAKPFVLSCLKILAAGPALPDLLPPEVLIDNWPWLYEELGVGEFHALAARLTAETDLTSHVVSLDFQVERAPLYTALVRAGGSSDAAFTSWSRHGLQSVSHEEWTRQLASEGQLLDLFLALLDAGVEVELDLAYMDALADHAKATAAGTSVPSRLAEAWPRLLTPLGRRRRKTFRRRVHDAAAATAETHEPFFGLYGDELADPDIIREDRQTPYRLFVPILQSRSIAGLTWLKRVLAELSPLEDQSFAPDTVADFKDRVQRALTENQGEEADAAIQQIAQMLNIRPSNDEAPPKQSDVAP